MKTRILQMAFAALAMAGCSQNEITETLPEADRAINFNVYTGVQTKAETTSESIKTAGFGVLAIKESTTPSYMTEQKVTHTGGAWTYPTTVYWPADGKTLKFYAYAPHSKATLTNTGGTVTLNDFTIDSSWSSMVDLVAATATPPAGSNVSVAMKHILSRVGFAAYTSEAVATGTTVTVTDVTIIGKTTNSASKFYEKGTYTYASTATNGTWANTTSKTADYSLLSSATVSVTGSTPGAANDLLNGGYLYCIPATSFAAGDIQVKVKYKTAINSVESIKEEIVKIPAGSWALGTAYKYTFKVTMNKIVFDNVTVDATWTSNTATDLVP